jgi:RNA polymerase sigma-70 factor, ECF subfamily
MTARQEPQAEPANAPGTNARVGSLVSAEDLAREHGAAVFAVCLAHTRNVHEAEDVMQETYLKAIGKLDTVRDARGVRSWLLQIARNMATERFRRRRPTQTLSDGHPAPAPVEGPAFEPLRAAMARLPDTYRETIALYYLDGRSCASVAAAQGIGEQTVRQRLLRGRWLLHELLKGDDQ